MCLDYELTKPEADKIKAEARKRGYIRVYKVFNAYNTGWSMGTRWRKGLRKGAYIKQPYGGWYALLTLKAARKELAIWNDPHYIKTCYAKPSWIKRLGMSDGHRVAIFTHLCFPDWDKGDMTIREFRAMCKGKK